MAQNRRPIPAAIQKAVLLKSRRRCCLCYWLDDIKGVRKGQLAHLDHNHDNHAEDNLAFLCFDHHDQYDGRTSTSKGLREDEVREYRERLYQALEQSPPVDISSVPLPDCPVPELPPHFVPRPDELRALKDIVLGADRPIGIVGLRGMGGIGKSVMAAWLARDDDVRAAFPDGVLWIVVGQTPTIESLGNLAAELRRATADRACLVILDDVWDADHAVAFRGLGPKSRLLLTTRDASVITGLGAAEYRLDQLDDSQTLDLLAKWSGEPRGQLDGQPAVRAVMRECGNLPLALAVCGAMRRDGAAWTEIRTSLETADLAALDAKIPGCRYNTVLKSLHVGVDFLRRTDAEMAQRYLELAVFPEDVRVPEAAVATLWAQTGGWPAHRTGIALARLNAKSLLRVDGTAPDRRISLHDLQRDYVRASADDLGRLHESLLAGYRRRSPKGWPSGPDDGYFFQQLGHHLVEAGHGDELRRLLLSFRWLRAQLDATDPNVVAADCDRLPDDQDVRLVGDAIRLSSHVLVSDKTQLGPQLIGRLSSYSTPPIKQLLENVTTPKGTFWLRPTTASLTPPGSGLIRTLEGHAGWVSAVAVTPDGRQAVSASWDQTLKVWDLRTGETLRTLEGHAGGVNAVAVTPDGRQAVSASDDKTLKVWDLRTGETLRTLEGHAGGVRAVAVTPDGRQAVSASSDQTLKVWDLRTGKAVATFYADASTLSCAVAPDGRSIVCGDGLGRVHFLRLEESTDDGDDEDWPPVEVHQEPRQPSEGEPAQFDVFFAHNSQDKPDVLVVKGELERRGVSAWIDCEQIPPGRWFQDVIQAAIPQVRSAAVFLGPGGLGRWQAVELRAFISQCVERGMPVIPVLLPGVEEIPPEMAFLRELNWVRFHHRTDEQDALDRLQWGITGERPHGP